MQLKYVVTETSSSGAKSETRWHYILPKAKTKSVVSLRLVFGPLLLKDCLVVKDRSQSTSEFLKPANYIQQKNFICPVDF